MITLRPEATRGRANHGWLQARHSFSFSSWQDPRYMGHSALRVINQDIVAGQTGFGQHPHANMEILTYVLRGTLSHRDTLGNTEDITAGEFQLMSAGSGIAHSEMNRYDEPVELLQIWLYPDRDGLPPRYAQRRFPREPGLQCVVAPEGSGEDALAIRQDARIHRGLLAAGDTVTHRQAPGRAGWLQLISGDIRLGGHALHAGDAAAIDNETLLAISADSDSEFLLFDLPPTAPEMN